MRIAVDSDPFFGLTQGANWRESTHWPASWVGCRGAQAPFVAAFRLKFRLDQGGTTRLHVSADERYELFLDGERIGRGPERGAPDVWFFESYELELCPGRHVLAATVWALGDIGLEAQMSSAPGFLLAAEGSLGELLSTGRAPWEARLLKGWSFRSTNYTQRGARFVLDGRLHTWDHEKGRGSGWQPVEIFKPAMGRWSDWDFHHNHRLYPAALPPMREDLLRAGTVRHVDAVGGTVEERRAVVVRAQDCLSAELPDWQALLEGKGTISIPAHTRRRVILELADYSAAYPELAVSGGKDAAVDLQWTESLRFSPDFYDWHKGSRAEIEGKHFSGLGDLFILDGGRRTYRPLYWMAGRYVEVSVQTAGEALRIEGLRFHERRYPLEMHSSFACSDPRLDEIQPILLRGMQMCSNETYMDCPYYEELMYTGDTRLEMLVTYVLMNDDRLPRKAMRLFDASRMPSGLTQSRYPCHATQVISTFALWWVGMVHDFLYWRSDTDYVRGLLPGVRANIQAFQRLLDARGLLRGAEGWNTIDWVPSWDADAGTPPDGHSGVSGVLNWQYVYALSLYEDLERRIGDPEQAAWAGRKADELAAAATAAFWNEGRGLLADDLAQTRFSEHSQILALLSGRLEPARSARAAQGLFAAADLDRATIYFSHYYFEVCRKLDRMDKFFERMGLWFYLKQMGFKTPVEMPEPGRSDCHAWSSHPLFHYFATLLGVRPAEPGFRSVVIEPRLGSLTWAKGRFPHPDGGEIAAEFRVEGGQMHARVELPPGLRGELRIGTERQVLTSGVFEGRFPL
jgi:alpha-L-rhamnosidase